MENREMRMCSLKGGKFLFNVFPSNVVFSNGRALKVRKSLEAAFRVCKRPK
jgi:hypothetical protein